MYLGHGDTSINFSLVLKLSVSMAFFVRSWVWFLILRFATELDYCSSADARLSPTSGAG